MSCSELCNQLLWPDTAVKSTCTLIKTAASLIMGSLDWFTYKCTTAAVFLPFNVFWLLPGEQVKPVFLVSRADEGGVRSVLSQGGIV